MPGMSTGDGAEGKRDLERHAHALGNPRARVAESPWINLFGLLIVLFVRL